MFDDCDTDDGEERAFIDTELERSEARWKSVVENSPEFIVLVDFEGRIEFLNRAHDELKNRSAVNTSIYDYIPPSYQDIVREKLAKVRQTGRSESYEVVAEGPNGTWAWYSARVGAVRNQGVITGLAIVSTDITEQKRTEEALVRAREELEQRVAARTAELEQANATLAASEERFRQLAENVEVVFWLCNADLTELHYVSPPFERLWEMERADVYREVRNVLERVHPDDRTRIKELLGKALPRMRFETEFRLQRKDGTIRWVRAREFSFLDKQHNITRIAGLAEDITERKLAREDLLAEQQFLRQLLAAHERDQNLTAHEIHDGLLQDVIGALMQLEGLQHGLALNAAEREQFDLALRLLRESIGEGRRLISGLRPLVIDQQGIVAGIQHLVDEHRARYGVTIEFCHRVNFQRLDPFVEGTIFRLVQESLNNIVRHSQANRISVDLSDDEQQLTLVVRDNGVGFKAQSSSAHGWGLEGMRKRAQLLGGRAEIQSAPGRGTEVRVVLPLNSTPSASAGSITSVPENG